MDAAVVNIAHGTDYDLRSSYFRFSWCDVRRYLVIANLYVCSELQGFLDMIGQLEMKFASKLDSNLIE